MRRLNLASLAVLAVLALAACGGTAHHECARGVVIPPRRRSRPYRLALACATAPVPADAAVTVEIKDFTFTPDPVTAKVGDVIAWTNSDSAPHTASLADGSCGTEQLATGSTGALSSARPGPTHTSATSIRAR